MVVGGGGAGGVRSLVSVGLSWGCPPPCSISEVLEWRQEDAEEILYNLGFARSEPGAVGRIPPRFFSAPSRARGIDFQLFLRAQVQRMEMEDPCLMLASEWGHAGPRAPPHPDTWGGLDPAQQLRFAPLGWWERCSRASVSPPVSWGIPPLPLPQLPALTRQPL